MRDCTIELDGRVVIERGKIVDEKMRVKREPRRGGEACEQSSWRLAMLAALTAQAADKVKIGFISTLSGPNASIGTDIRDALQSRGQAERRQARRPARRGAGGRRPAQAREREAARRALPAARQGRLHHRHRVLEHRDGGGARCDREQGVLHLAERRSRRSSPARSATRSSSPLRGRARPTARPPGST